MEKTKKKKGNILGNASRRMTDESRDICRQLEELGIESPTKRKIKDRDLLEQLLEEK